MYQGCNHSQSYYKNKKYKVDNIVENVSCDDKTQQRVLRNIKTKSDSNAIQISNLGSSMKVSINFHQRLFYDSSGKQIMAYSMQVNAELNDREKDTQ